MSETSSDRTAAIATPNDAEKSALQGDASHEGTTTTPTGSTANAAKGKQKMTHEEKEAARTGWRAEVQEIPKQVCPIPSLDMVYSSAPMQAHMPRSAITLG